MKKKPKKAEVWTSLYIKQEEPGAFEKHRESILFLGNLSLSGDRGVLTSSRERPKLLEWLRSWGFVVEGTDFRGHDAACASYLKDRPKASDGSRMGDLYARHHRVAQKLTEKDRKKATKDVRLALKAYEERVQYFEDLLKLETSKGKDIVSNALEQLVVTFGPGPYVINDKYYFVGCIPQSTRLYLVPQPHLDKKAKKAGGQ